MNESDKLSDTMHTHELRAHPAIGSDLLAGLPLVQGTTQIRMVQPGSIVSVATSESRIPALNTTLESLFRTSFPLPGQVHRTDAGISLLGLQKQQCFLIAESDENAPAENAREEHAPDENASAEPEFHAGKTLEDTSLTQQPGLDKGEVTGNNSYQQHLNRLLELNQQLAGKAYITDQTDAWLAVLLDGPDVRSVLERLCSLDMHADKFTRQHVARTIIDHLTVIIERTDDDLYRLYTPRSSALDFVSALSTALTSVCNRV